MLHLGQHEETLMTEFQVQNAINRWMILRCGKTVGHPSNLCSEAKVKFTLWLPCMLTSSVVTVTLRDKRT
jgi:hypothetical protein